MRRLLLRPLVLTVLFAAIVPWALAQTTVSARFPSAGRSGPPPSMPGVRSLPAGENFSNFRRFRGRNPNALPFFPFGLFSDALLFDNPSPPQTPEPSAGSPSALNLIEALSSLGKASQPMPPSPAQPLLIELQGDRYVRVSNGEVSENPRDSSEPIRVTASAAPASARATAKSETHPPIARELPPVSLIFRDGHTEDVRDYSIVGGVMYARGDYYTDGYWNKQIELASIDVPATLKTNTDRNVKFVLPSSPNEVVTRP